ncbi:MAG: cyclic nucleotide-binding domain-containing protein [Nitrospinaceae bacterium]
MATDDPLKLLEGNPFFELFSAEERREISKFSDKILDFNREEIVVRQGLKDPSLYVLLTGEVKVIRDELPGVSLARLKPGAVFGSIPFLPVTPRPTNIVAGTPVAVMKIDRPMLNSLDPMIVNHFKDQFLKVLFHRVENVNIEMTQFKSGLKCVHSACENINKELDNLDPTPQNIKIISNFAVQQLKGLID